MRQTGQRGPTGFFLHSYISLVSDQKKKIKKKEQGEGMVAMTTDSISILISLPPSLFSLPICQSLMLAVRVGSD